MPEPRTRRQLLKDIGGVCAGSMLVGDAALAGSAATQIAPADGTIVPRTSTSGVFVPPRGRSFQKFSFDFPEPSVAFAGLEFGFRVFTHENV